MALRILLATDAWHPQVNGVVRTYARVMREAANFGAEIVPLTAEGRRTLPLPTYPEVRVCLMTSTAVGAVVARERPDFIHIATEGPIGLATRAWCRRAGFPFTTAYHTKFPEYLAARSPIPTAAAYALQRWFHSGGIGMMVATPSLGRMLTGRGFANVLPWTRGVDLAAFHPAAGRIDLGPRPVMLTVGRAAVEKNLDAFLKLNRPGTKVVIGEGPELPRLRQRYPEAVLPGAKSGEELARYYASADVFVFPSRTDTFGVVQLEALASGLPVAAFPVTGPLDVVEEGVSGALDEDLGRAIDRALSLDPAKARARAEQFSWKECARLFFDNIVGANARAGHRPLAAAGETRLGDGKQRRAALW